MIRALQEADIERVAEIWLDSNLKAHHFIPAQYWKSNFELVKEMLSQAEVYAYENDRNIQGFTGLNGEYIEGIFVSDEMQSRGDGAAARGGQLELKIRPDQSRSDLKTQRVFNLWWQLGRWVYVSGAGEERTDGAAPRHVPSAV